MIRFTVSGRPVPAQRPRVVNGHAYTPDATREAEVRIGRAYLAAGGVVHDGPVRVAICAVFDRPQKPGKKSVGAYHWIRPDVDNLAKTVLDGLNRRAWLDDSQVAELEVVKIYGDRAETIIIVCPLEDQA